jgi:FAD:protein FMN transferase
MRANRIIMGTGVSLDVPNLADVKVLDRVFSRLTQIDRRFSTYRYNSEVSRFRRGELREDELSSDFRIVMRGCLEMEKATNGYFSAWFSGEFDPSGYVKAWAIREAARIIRKSGFSTFCVGIGGDIYARSNNRKIWRIGIENPHRPNTILGVIKARNIAVATSGNYKRGAHVFDPKKKQPVNYFSSVTVAGPGIIKADVFATAAFVMGPKGPAFIQRQPRYEGLFIDIDGHLAATAGMERLLGQLSLEV